MLGASAVQAGPFLYVHDATGNLGTVDVATGDVIVIGDMGVTLTDIAFDPNGNLFGISLFNLYQINYETAAISLVGPQLSIMVIYF